eukprot:COSAG05_NODE_2057_length_3631_cov_3.848528_1_plen_191_part_00
MGADHSPSAENALLRGVYAADGAETPLPPQHRHQVLVTLPAKVRSRAMCAARDRYPGESPVVDAALSGLQPRHEPLAVAAARGRCRCPGQLCLPFLRDERCLQHWLTPAVGYSRSRSAARARGRFYYLQLYSCIHDTYLDRSSTHIECSNTQFSTAAAALGQGRNAGAPGALNGGLATPNRPQPSSQPPL